jgi:hypothetical protein
MSHDERVDDVSARSAGWPRWLHCAVVLSMAGALFSWTFFEAPFGARYDDFDRIGNTEFMYGEVEPYPYVAVTLTSGERVVWKHEAQQRGGVYGSELRHACENGGMVAFAGERLTPECLYRSTEPAVGVLRRASDGARARPDFEGVEVLSRYSSGANRIRTLYDLGWADRLPCRAFWRGSNPDAPDKVECLLSTRRSTSSRIWLVVVALAPWLVLGLLILTIWQRLIDRRVRRRKAEL